MAGFDDPALYGDRWADVYDERHGSLDPATAVEFRAGISGDGPVLELAIGTTPTGTGARTTQPVAATSRSTVRPDAPSRNARASGDEPPASPGQRSGAALERIV
jgi:hypothetical protein